MNPRRNSLFLLYVCLLVTVVWLLSLPPATIAAQGTANCPGGQRVSCNAYRCDCTDNIGCTGYDSNGNEVSSQTKSCESSGGGGIGIVEGPTT
jgi:hypothetical protein